MNLKAEQNHALSFFLKAIQTNNGTKNEHSSEKATKMWRLSGRTSMKAEQNNAP